MGYGDEKIVVDVRESCRGSILYKDAAGKESTYYPKMTTWFTVEDLETFVILDEPPEGTTEPRSSGAHAASRGWETTACLSSATPRPGLTRSPCLSKPMSGGRRSRLKTKTIEHRIHPTLRAGCRRTRGAQ